MGGLLTLLEVAVEATAGSDPEWWEAGKREFLADPNFLQRCAARWFCAGLCLPSISAVTFRVNCDRVCRQSVRL